MQYFDDLDKVGVDEQTTPFHSFHHFLFLLVFFRYDMVVLFGECSSRLEGCRYFLNDSSGTIGEGYISTSITLYTKRTVFVAVVTFFGGLMKLISRFLKYIYERVCVCSRQAFVYMYVGIY